MVDTAYDQFIGLLRQHHPISLETTIAHLLTHLTPMTGSDKLQQIDKLKGWLDSFRPLPAVVVAELKQRYDVQFTITPMRSKVTL